MQRNHEHNSKRLNGELPIRQGRSVLFVDSQGLGDVVQSLPLLKAVCLWAEGRWPVQALFATTNHYEIIREEKLNVTPFFIGSVPRSARSVCSLWRKLVGRPDLIVCAPGMSDAKLVGLKYALGAGYAVGEARPRCDRFGTASMERSWTRPWAEAQDAIAAALGIQTPLEPPSIRLTQTEIEWAERTLRRVTGNSALPIFGIQCSSTVPQKCWPLEYFSRVATEIQMLYPCICFISFGGKAEQASAEAVYRSLNNVSWLEGAGKWNIRQTLAMLNRCDVFLSGDTGLMHMAAAVGTPTVSIFGPTSAVRRAPTHNRGIAVCPETSCHPCFRGAWKECQCIRSIKPDRVIAPVEKCIFGNHGLAKRRKVAGPEAPWKLDHSFVQPH